MSAEELFQEPDTVKLDAPPKDGNRRVSLGSLMGKGLVSGMKGFWEQGGNTSKQPFGKGSRVSTRAVINPVTQSQDRGLLFKLPADVLNAAGADSEEQSADLARSVSVSVAGLGPATALDHSDSVQQDGTPTSKANKTPKSGLKKMWQSMTGRTSKGSHAHSPAVASADSAPVHTGLNASVPYDRTDDDTSPADQHGSDFITATTTSMPLGSTCLAQEEPQPSPDALDNHCQTEDDVVLDSGSCHDADAALHADEHALQGMFSAPGETTMAAVHDTLMSAPASPSPPSPAAVAASESAACVPQPEADEAMEPVTVFPSDAADCSDSALQLPDEHLQSAAHANGHAMDTDMAGSGDVLMSPCAPSSPARAASDAETAEHAAVEASPAPASLAAHAMFGDSEQQQQQQEEGQLARGACEVEHAADDEQQLCSAADGMAADDLSTHMVEAACELAVGVVTAAEPDQAVEPAADSIADVDMGADLDMQEALDAPTEQPEPEAADQPAACCEQSAAPVAPAEQQPAAASEEEEEPAGMPEDLPATATVPCAVEQPQPEPAAVCDSPASSSVRELLSAAAMEGAEAAGAVPAQNDELQAVCEPMSALVLDEAAAEAAADPTCGAEAVPAAVVPADSCLPTPADAADMDMDMDSTMPDAAVEVSVPEVPTAAIDDQLTGFAADDAAAADDADLDAAADLLQLAALAAKEQEDSPALCAVDDGAMDMDVSTPDEVEAFAAVEPVEDAPAADTHPEAPAAAAAESTEELPVAAAEAEPDAAVAAAADDLAPAASVQEDAELPSEVADADVCPPAPAAPDVDDHLFEQAAVPAADAAASTPQDIADAEAAEVDAAEGTVNLTAWFAQHTQAAAAPEAAADEPADSAAELRGVDAAEGALEAAQATSDEPAAEVGGAEAAASEDEQPDADAPAPEAQPEAEEAAMDVEMDEAGPATDPPADMPEQEAEEVPLQAVDGADASAAELQQLPVRCVAPAVNEAAADDPPIDAATAPAAQASDHEADATAPPAAEQQEQDASCASPAAAHASNSQEEEAAAAAAAEEFMPSASADDCASAEPVAAVRELDTMADVAPGSPAAAPAAPVTPISVRDSVFADLLAFELGPKATPPPRPAPEALPAAADDSALGFDECRDELLDARMLSPEPAANNGNDTASLAAILKAAAGGEHTACLPAAAADAEPLGSPVHEGADLDLQPFGHETLGLLDMDMEDAFKGEVGFGEPLTPGGLTMPALQSTPSPVNSNQNSPRVHEKKAESAQMQMSRASIPLFVRDSFLVSDSVSLERQSLQGMEPFSQRPATRPAEFLASTIKLDTLPEEASFVGELLPGDGPAARQAAAARAAAHRVATGVLDLEDMNDLPHLPDPVQDMELLLDAHASPVRAAIAPIGPDAVLSPMVAYPAPAAAPVPYTPHAVAAPSPLPAAPQPAPSAAKPGVTGKGTPRNYTFGSALKRAAPPGSVAKQPAAAATPLSKAVADPSAVPLSMQKTGAKPAAGPSATIKKPTPMKPGMLGSATPVSRLPPPTASKLPHSVVKTPAPAGTSSILQQAQQQQAAAAAANTRAVAADSPRLGPLASPNLMSHGAPSPAQGTPTLLPQQQPQSAASTPRLRTAAVTPTPAGRGAAPMPGLPLSWNTPLMQMQQLPINLAVNMPLGAETPGGGLLDLDLDTTNIAEEAAKFHQSLFAVTPVPGKSGSAAMDTPLMALGGGGKGTPAMFSQQLSQGSSTTSKPQHAQQSPLPMGMTPQPTPAAAGAGSNMFISPMAGISPMLGLGGADAAAGGAAPSAPNSVLGARLGSGNVGSVAASPGMVNLHAMQLDAYMAQIARMAEELGTLKQENEGLKDQIKTMKFEQEMREGESGAAEMEHEARLFAEEQLVIVKAQAQELQDQVRQTQQALADQLAAHEALQADLARVQKEREQSEAALARAAAERDAAVARAEQLQAQLTSKQDECTALGAAVAAAEGRAAEVQQDAAAKGQDVTRLRKQRDDLMRNMKQITDQQIADKLAHQKQLGEVTKRESAYEQYVARLKSEREDARRQATEEHAKFTKLQAEHKELTKIAENLMDQMERIQAQRGRA